MEFIDLAAQQRRIKGQIDAAMAAVLAHGQYINGPEVLELEEKLAAYAGVKHAVGCSSGTDALLMALMALGIGPGHAVFTTPFTFIATAEVINLLGATPVFVDIDPDTFNIEAGSLEDAVSALKSWDPSVHPLPEKRPPQLIPKAVIPVDLFGLPADYDTLEAVAKRHNLVVIEDGAQSFGGEYKGEKSCSFGDIACTSFFPAKPLGCYGDGGMCFTDDDDLAGILRSLRVHGQGGNRYDNVRIGINGRLDTLQAAILLAKFGIFPEEIELRQKVAQSYTGLLKGKAVQPPEVEVGYKSAWAQYSVLAKDEESRDVFMARLKKEGIPTAIHYPKPLHLQQAFAGLGYKKGDFPVSEDYAKRIFSLPMHPYLTWEEQIRIADLLSA